MWSIDSILVYKNSDRERVSKETLLLFVSVLRGTGRAVTAEGSSKAEVF